MNIRNRCTKVCLFLWVLGMCFAAHPLHAQSVIPVPLKIAVNAGQIKYITNGLLILNKSIIPDFKKDDTDTRIYHIIYDWCIDNGVVPPDRNDEIKIMEDGSIRRKNSLLLEIAGKLDYMKDEEIRSLLTNRITSEEITLEYIAKVLNINNKKKEEIEYSIIMLD